MRISDWSSDVCSSDLPRRRQLGAMVEHPAHLALARVAPPDGGEIAERRALLPGAGRRAAVAVATDIDGVRLPRHCPRGVGLALQHTAGEHALRSENPPILRRCTTKCLPLPSLPPHPPQAEIGH